MRTFTIDDKQEAMVKAWLHNHDCGYVPAATMGDFEQYHFTPSGIGTFVHVHCPCGAELDLNDYDSF